MDELAICYYCKLPTNGSQMHRQCRMELDRHIFQAENSKEIQEQEDQIAHFEAEDEYTQIQGASMQRFTTSIKTVHPELYCRYPLELFNSPAYKNIDIPYYLSCRMNKVEFYIRRNEIMNLTQTFIPPGKNQNISMVEEIHSMFNKHTQIHQVICSYCFSCVEWPKNNDDYTQGYIEIDVPTPNDLDSLVAEFPDLFFCYKCSSFVIDMIMNNYKTVKHGYVLQNVNNSKTHEGVTLYGKKLSNALITANARRRLNFGDGSSTSCRTQEAITK